MSNSYYTPLSGTARLIAAATSAIVTFSIFTAVAVGMTGGDTTGHGTAAVAAAGAAPHPA